MSAIPKRHEIILNAICNLKTDKCNFVQLQALINHFQKSPIAKEFWDIWVTTSGEARSEEITEDVWCLHARGYIRLDNSDRIILTQRTFNLLCEVAQ